MKNFASQFSIRFILQAFFLFCLSSCSSSLRLDKRHYGNGYYVSINDHKNAESKTIDAVQLPEHSTIQKPEVPIHTSLKEKESVHPIRFSQDMKRLKSSAPFFRNKTKCQKNADVTMDLKTLPVQAFRNTPNPPAVSSNSTYQNNISALGAAFLIALGICIVFIIVCICRALNRVSDFFSSL
jgi:hypothetical protein